jgi:hypothetical protein
MIEDEAGTGDLDEYVRPNTRPRGPWHALASEHAAIAYAACGWARDTAAIERRTDRPAPDLLCRRCAEHLAARRTRPG